MNELVLHNINAILIFLIPMFFTLLASFLRLFFARVSVWMQKEVSNMGENKQLLLRQACNIAVLFVEQLVKNEEIENIAEQKLEAALRAAAELLEDIGINADAKTLRVIIEAIIARMNNTK